MLISGSFYFGEDWKERCDQSKTKVLLALLQVPFLMRKWDWINYRKRLCYFSLCFHIARVRKPSLQEILPRKQTLLHSRMWHIQVKVIVNLNFECGAVTFRGWLWIPSHSQNSWFWIASCIFKVIFSQQSDILWRSDVFCSSAEVLQKVQVMHSGCKQCTVGASNATHSGRKQCNAQ